MTAQLTAREAHSLLGLFLEEHPAQQGRSVDEAWTALIVHIERGVDPAPALRRELPSWGWWVIALTASSAAWAALVRVVCS